MYQIKKLILISGLATLLTGCLLPQQQVQFQSDIQSLDQRLRSIEQRPIQQTTPLLDNNQLTTIRHQQANLKAEMDSLRVDVQTLAGRFEDQQHSIQQLRDELTLAQNDLSLQVSTLENRAASNSPPPPATNSTPPVIQAPVIKTPAVVQTAASVVKQPIVTTQSTPSTADELYQRALQLVQQSGDFGQSRNLFKQFIHQYPTHDLTVNAMYWIGETYYGDKQYESAILQFQDVIQKYPEHQKIPAALMKQGLAFYALGDTNNGQVILQKVISNYPKSPEAQKAQIRLSTWQ
jgi:tol-pal system protein YbgF